MKRIVKILTIIVFIILLSIMHKSTSYAESHSGIWGNLTWTLDEDGLLTINGNGPINDFQFLSTDAWNAYRSDIKSIKIKNGVTSIGNYAFGWCFNLTSIIAPDGIASIGNAALQGCSNLINIKIPNDVTTIGDAAFNGCSGLISISIPNGLTSIGEAAFLGCSSLTGIIIPNSVTNIGQDAFENCCNMASITISDNVTTIRNGTFNNCSSLTYVLIPNGVTSIGDGAFSFCNRLTSITIPNSVTSIGEMGFAGCSSLSSITLSESLTSIGQQAFIECSSLKKIYIPNSVNHIESEAFEQYCSIYCYEFSYAESYGNNHNYRVVLLDGKLEVALPETMIVAVGLEKQIPANIMPRTDNQRIKWESSDPSIATVTQQGVLTALKVGEVTVTLTVNDTVADTVIQCVPPAKQIIIQDEIWVAAKTTEHIVLQTSPTTAVTNLSWKTEDDNFAFVDDQGNISGNAVGDTILTVTDAITGLSASATVHISYPVTEITLIPENANLEKGKTLQLTANVKMRDQSCVNQLVTYSSSDESIATVTKTGLVKAVGAGKAIITATAQSGVSATISVEVVSAPTNASGDANGDGKVNMQDALLILQYECGQEVINNTVIADVTGDGIVNMLDAMLILQYDCGWNTELK